MIAHTTGMNHLKIVSTQANEKECVEVKVVKFFPPTPGRHTGVEVQLHGFVIDVGAVPQEGTPVRIEYEAGWAPEPVWTFGEEKNLFPLLGVELRNDHAVSL